MTQQSALCGAITGFLGFQAGLVGHSGAYYAGQPTYGTGGSAGDDATDGNVLDGGCGHSAVNSLASVVQSGGTGLVDLGGVTTEGDCCISGDSLDDAVANKVIGTCQLSFDEFIASDHFENLRVDLSDMQHAFIEELSGTGFPVDWDMCSILSRMLAVDPHNSNLLGFDLVKLYAFVPLRRREVPGFPYDDYKPFSTDMLDGVFVDFVARTLKKFVLTVMGRSLFTIATRR